MLLVTARMQSWHRAMLGQGWGCCSSPSSLKSTWIFLHPHSVGDVVSPQCFYRMGRVWGALAGSWTLLLVLELGRP